MFTDKVVLKLDFEISVQYFSMKKDKEPPKQREWHEKRRGQRLDIQATAFHYANLSSFSSITESRRDRV